MRKFPLLSAMEITPGVASDAKELHTVLLMLFQSSVFGCFDLRQNFVNKGVAINKGPTALPSMVANILGLREQVDLVYKTLL